MDTVKDIRKILIVNLGGIGDCLLSLPALRSLKKLYPKGRMSFLGVPRACGFVSEFDLFDEVISFEIYDEKIRKFHPGRLIKFLKIFFFLRKKRFDMAINMRTIVSLMSALKMALLFYFIGARLKVGRDTAGRGFFLNIKVKETALGEKHEMEYDLDTIAALGAKIADKTIPLIINSADRENINKRLLEAGVREGDVLIGIHVGGMPSRRWPVAYFAEMIDMLEQKLHCSFVITGGFGEEELFNRLKEKCKARLVDMVDKTSLEEWFVLISRCSLFVSNDTGAMHVAAVLRTPLVAIFGGGYLKRYDPRAISDKAVVLYRDVSCAPCDRVNCRSMRCLKEIMPKDAAEAVLALFKKG